jgi:hypothetical protein
MLERRKMFVPPTSTPQLLLLLLLLLSLTCSITQAQVVETITDPVPIYDPDDSTVNATRAATAFECNVNNQKILRNEKLKSGEEIRVCIKPTLETLNAGVYIKNIENFEFSKKSADDNFQVKQGAIVEDAVGDGGKTTLACVAGSSICSITTKLNDNFFDSEGEVRGKGQVALQFGTTGRRQMRKVNLELESTSSSSSSLHEPEQEEGHAETVPQQPRRSLQEQGAFEGWSTVLYTFNVEKAPKGSSGATATKQGERGVLFVLMLGSSLLWLDPLLAIVV